MIKPPPEWTDGYSKEEMSMLLDAIEEAPVVAERWLKKVGVPSLEWNGRWAQGPAPQWCPHCRGELAKFSPGHPEKIFECLCSEEKKLQAVLGKIN